MDGKYCNYSVTTFGYWSFVDKHEPWLLIEIPSRDSFLVTRYLERQEAVLQLIGILQGINLVMHHAITSTREVRWCNVTGNSTLQPVTVRSAWTSKRTFIVERIYEGEFHEHSIGIFNEAIGTEWIHVEDKVYFYSLGGLLWKIRTGSSGEKSNGS